MARCDVQGRTSEFAERIQAFEMLNKKQSLCTNLTVRPNESSNVEFQKPPGAKISDPEILKKSCTFFNIVEVTEFHIQKSIGYFVPFKIFERSALKVEKVLNSFNKRFE